MVLHAKNLLTRIRPQTLNNELQRLFLNRLSRLLHNGYTLVESLEIIQWDNSLKKPAKTITETLKNGNNLDEAFEEAHFSPLVTTYLYFVRTNGDIQASIHKCLVMFDQRLQYTRKFQQVARYPALLLVIFSVVLFFIKHSVLPSFQSLFQSSAEASSIVSVTILVINVLMSILFILIILALITTIFWQINKHKVSVSKQIKLFSAIPFYRKYKQIHTSFLFATHFSSLLKSGIPIKEILNTMAEQSKMPVLSHYATLMTEELNRGNHLASLLAQFQLLDRQIPLIFQKNADTTALEKDLSVYAEFLTEELSRKIMKSLTYIQPVFFLILAGLIVFIYMSLMWPMFQLIKTI